MGTHGCVNTPWSRGIEGRLWTLVVEETLRIRLECFAWNCVFCCFFFFYRKEQQGCEVQTQALERDQSALLWTQKQNNRWIYRYYEQSRPLRLKTEKWTVRATATAALRERSLSSFKIRVDRFSRLLDFYPIRPDLHPGPTSPNLVNLILAGS